MVYGVLFQPGRECAKVGKEDKEKRASGCYCALKLLIIVDVVVVAAFLLLFFRYSRGKRERKRRDD